MNAINKVMGVALVFGLTACAIEDSSQERVQNGKIDSIEQHTPLTKAELLESKVIEGRLRTARKELSLHSPMVAHDQQVYGAQLPSAYHPYHSVEATDRENYQQLTPNNVKRVIEDPVSTFSIDVDTASYSNMRRMLATEGRLPPQDAIRVEELINYFNYDYPVPQDTSEPFAIHTEMAPSPWSGRRQLLKIGLKGYEPNIEARPSSKFSLFN